jgi:polar amino acid transport system permease protein
MSGARRSSAFTRSETIFVAGFAGIVAGLVLATRENLAVLVPQLLNGFWVTISITVSAAFISIVLAFVTGLAKLSRSMFVRGPAIAYAELFRGTSLLVQLFWLYYVLPHFGILLDATLVGIFAVALNFGAYGSEFVRGAVQAVPKGQWDAITALNIGYRSAMRDIILPQAIVAMIPPYGNLMIQLLKSTSLVSLITIQDLTFAAYQLDQFTGETTKIFSIVLAVYFAMALCISMLFRSLERRFEIAPEEGK